MAMQSLKLHLIIICIIWIYLKILASYNAFPFTLETELACQSQSVQEWKRKAAGLEDGGLCPLLHIPMIMWWSCANASNIFIRLSDSAMKSDKLVKANSSPPAFYLLHESLSGYDTLCWGNCTSYLWRFLHVAGKYLIIQHCWMLFVS